MLQVSGRASSVGCHGERDRGAADVAAGRSSGLAADPLVFGGPSGGLVHNVLQPRPELHDHAALHTGDCLPTVRVRHGLQGLQIKHIFLFL